MTTTDKLMYGIAAVIVLVVIIALLDMACMVVLDKRLTEAAVELLSDRRWATIVPTMAAPTTTPSLPKSTTMPRPTDKPEQKPVVKPTPRTDMKTNVTTWRIHAGETAGDTLIEWHELNPDKEMVTWSVGVDGSGNPVEIRIEWRKK